jgi:cytochrome c nitrite reductase small subunit
VETPNTQPETPEPEGKPSEDQPKAKKKPNWFKISIIANIVIVALIAVAAASMGIIYQSDTNPNFCGTCHIMDRNVTSYLTSVNLDHVHAEAGVECKECHDYPVSAEISSGFKFIIHDYKTDEEGMLAKRKFGDDMCLQCHISNDFVATQTDFLARNPHRSHFGALACNTCHVGHGEQIDYCSTCHDNGGQRMVGEPIEPRGTISGRP